MALPPAFISQLQALLPDEWNDLVKAITSTPPVVSVRVNPLRNASVPPTAQRVPWWQQGFYCDERPQFTFDTQFHSGMYYVQDASSMFVAHLIKCLIDKPVCYLDLCAAPGGKSTAALDALPSGSLVVANEIVPSRARILLDNITKWGHPCAVVTNNDPARLGTLSHTFDVVAVDAPCSGEGMMRKDVVAIEQWTQHLVEECAQRQRHIIDDIWPALKPGGLLIYSTCTYNRQENEDLVAHLIDHYGATPVVVPIDPKWNIAPALDGGCTAYRFFPHRTLGEGLFVAVVRKPDGAAKKPPKAHHHTTKSTAIPAEITSWINGKDEYLFTQADGAVIAIPNTWRQEIGLLRHRLNVLSCGIPVAESKGRGFVPSHALAMSTALNISAFPQCKVDYPRAIAFLRGEAITIDAPRGFTLITHRNSALGWVNNLGNRANNLYPKPLRITSTHAPDTEPNVLA